MVKKKRFNHIGTLEARFFEESLQFSTTPDHREVVAEITQTQAVELAAEILSWAAGKTDKPTPVTVVMGAGPNIEAIMATIKLQHEEIQRLSGVPNPARIIDPEESRRIHKHLLEMKPLMVRRPETPVPGYEDLPQNQNHKRKPSKYK